MAQAAEDALVELIYAAALDPALWPTAMAGVADRLGGTQSALTRLDIRDGSGEGILSRADPDWTPAYHEHFRSKNVLMIVDDPAAYARGYSARVLTESDCLSWEDFQASEYFNDFMRPQDVGPALFIRLELSETAGANLNIGRSVRGERFGRAELEAAESLQPHLIRAYRFGRALAVTLGADRDLARAVSNSPHAIFLVGEGGAMRLVNPTGERLLAADKGLTVLNGCLTARHSEHERRLGALIAAATAAGAPREGGAMSLPLPGRRFPLAIRVTPIPVTPAPIFGHPQSALVCVTDLETEVRSPEEELRALFGLTYAEARVATAIFEGLSMREASTALGVALNTVRFQLARVYDKTGATRQAELVKMMMRLSSGAGDGGRA